MMSVHFFIMLRLLTLLLMQQTAEERFAKNARTGMMIKNVTAVSSSSFIF